MKEQLRKLKNSLFKNMFENLSGFENYSKLSFSQSGEDMIMKFVFDSINIEQIDWIDIGAFHPYKFNNTAHFYLRGYQGINIDADSESVKLFNQFRPKDVNLNIGIDIEKKEREFYAMSAPTLSTFSKEEAMKYRDKYGYLIEEIRKIQTDTIMNIITTYSNGIFPKLLSIDIEGLDDIVLKTINFSTSFPVIICAETISFSTTREGKKNHEIISYLQNRGYVVYADTYVNTIFVKKEIWESI